ncbi:MAG TPA: hypothetical protein VK668_06240 [Mucilaginibacter sp.]|nr:hypothetical protein [Mucilaginibacter sp.]
MNNYAILVNTTDSFEDCWEPFFKLFSIYWPDYKGKIYLNTESKEFSYPGLNIIPVRNGSGGASKNTWSKCLATALHKISEDIVLYMQEDYFLQDTVQTSIIDHYAAIIRNDNVDCIHFTYHSTPGPFAPSTYEGLWEIDKKAPYRLSCQTALWKKKVLKQYVRNHENPWQFEMYGTKRASLLNHKFYTVNRDMYGLEENTIINYFFTGIVKGRWKQGVVDLFKKHNITIDYQLRGFFTYEQKRESLTRFIRRKLNSAPVAIKSRLEIFRLRYYSQVKDLKYHFWFRSFVDE